MTLYDSYIQKVQTGEIVAGENIRQAVQRHLDDLKQSKKRNFQFYFDEKIADTAIKIIQVMPLTSAREYQGFPFKNGKRLLLRCCTVGELKRQR
jgi:phage terminase large subunit-like protein